MENQNIQPNPIITEGPAKENWFISHRFLWAVVVCLLLIVITATAYWWQEIKNQSANVQKICIEGTLPEDCNDTIQIDATLK